MSLIQLRNIKKKFKDKIIFDNFNLDIDKGDFVVIIGKSGSGKSTLLNLLGLLDSPDSGSVTIANESNIRPFSTKAQKLLQHQIGYLFQNFALIDDKTVLANLKIAFTTKPKDYLKIIDETLTRVGLVNFQPKPVYQCSGGEQQRIALARLIIKNSNIILCDEPTGSLDAENKEMVIKLLKELNSEGKTLIIVTHDNDFLQYADKVVNLND